METMQGRASYLDLTAAELSERAERAYDLMQPTCRLCPRRCGAARMEGEKGECGAGDRLFVSSHTLHFGEEPPVSGTRGSGTIFLTHCNLHCLYCQNYPISQMGNGRETGTQDLARMMTALQEKGAHNINWVTPTHEAAHLLEGLAAAREMGLRLPIVYNSSGYDAVETLRLFEGIVDIYMPDMRYADGRVAKTYSGAGDYPEVNRKGIREMFRQVGDLRLGPDGVATKGLLVRHLVLPGGISGTEEVMRFLAEQVSPGTYVSLMNQYFPAYKAPGIQGIDRRITAGEYREAREIVEKYGLTRGWMQEMV